MWVSRWRTVMSRASASVSSSEVAPGRSTRVAPNPGIHCLIGSSSVMRPSSTSINVMTAVISLVFECARWIWSGRIGWLCSMSA